MKTARGDTTLCFDPSGLQGDYSMQLGVTHAIYMSRADDMSILRYWFYVQKLDQTVCIIKTQHLTRCSFELLDGNRGDL